MIDSAIASRTAAARAAVAGLRQTFLAAPHRPNGPTGPTAALASLVDELDWLLSFLVPRADLPSLDLCRDENAEAVAATVAALRASAATLAGGDERPDFQRIEVARDAVARVLVRRISALPPAPDDRRLESALEPPFRIRVISYSARQVAGYALLASGIAAPELDELDVAGGDPGTLPTLDALQATQQFAVEHAGAGSVWFRNSVRGAVGLALAVLVAKVTDARTPSGSCWGRSRFCARARWRPARRWSRRSPGRLIGIVVGGLLVLAIGTTTTSSGRSCPLAVLLGAYSPRAISFTAGPGWLHGRAVVLFNMHSARGLDGRAGPDRGRRDRFCDQPRRRPALLAARRSDGDARESGFGVRTQRGLRRRGCSSDHWRTSRPSHPAPGSLPPPLSTNWTTPFDKRSPSGPQGR